MKPAAYTRSLMVTGVLVGSLLLTASQVYSQLGNIRYAKQGYSMRLCFDNKGVLGHAAYPAGVNAPPESLGLEYPISSVYEHIFGAGIWVGGILDTSTGPTPAFVRGVSTSYEGWAGPLFEFYPGSSPADSIWKVNGRGVPRPVAWDAYWGNSIPSSSFSDNDHYCRYSDEHVTPRVAGHIPLRLKVVQSGYVWSDPYAEAIHILEYKFMNMGVKQIDSAYFGMFLDGDVGPIHVPNYWQHNYTGYYADSRTAYIHNPVDMGSTPVGITVIHASRPLDSLRYAFRWWPNPQHPGTDTAKYARLSSGVIQPDEYPNLSETRFLLSFGPFTLRPPGNPNHDTLVVAVGVVSGQSLSALRLHAERAKAIYLNGGQVSVDPFGKEIPEQFELFQNYPNPFNPATTIQFALPKSSHVRLSIFNILGEEVAVLVNSELSGGMHSVEWNAKDKSSGVYFYRLQAGDYLEAKKLILLR